MKSAEEAAKPKATSCTVAEAVGHNFTFLQKSVASEHWDSYVLLDNQPTCHVFKNKSLLVNIQPALIPIAIHSTAGTSYADTVGYIPHFPDPVYICESGIANILSFAKVRSAGCEIIYDGDVDAFVVYGPTRSLTFHRLPSGLYGHQVQTTGVCLVNTVDSLVAGYSPRQVAAAKSA